MLKLMKLDIKISDFFELNQLQLEADQNINIYLKSKATKVLMKGALREKEVEICKDGGTA